MKVIVGLGNPGKKYEKTRHNAGFIVIDELAKKLGCTSFTDKFKAKVCETFVGSEKVILIKPQTYMNLSGESVSAVVDYYDIYLDDLLVITDDKDMEVGQLRIRLKGSSGGQNGIKSIIQHLGTQEFSRLKVGIGSHPHMNAADYVMGKIDEEVAIDKAVDAAYDFCSGKDMLSIMNVYNMKGNS